MKAMRTGAKFDSTSQNGSIVRQVIPGSIPLVNWSEHVYDTTLLPETTGSSSLAHPIDVYCPTKFAEWAA